MSIDPRGAPLQHSQSAEQTVASPDPPEAAEPVPMEQQLKLAMEVNEGIRHGATAAPQLIKKTSHQLAFQQIAALVHSLGPLDTRN